MSTALRTSGVVYALTVADRPGIAQAVAAVFAHRGLSMNALVADSARVPTRLLVEFYGTPRQQTMIRRALERLHHVEACTCRPVDAPELRAVALCQLQPRARWPRLGGVEVDSSDIKGAKLIHGQLAAVNAALETLRGSGKLEAVSRSIVAL